MFSKNFLSFLTKNWPKVNEATCKYVNIAPMQSNMLNLMKILKSCFKVMQRSKGLCDPGKIGWEIHFQCNFTGKMEAWPNFSSKFCQWVTATFVLFLELYVPDIQSTRWKLRLKLIKKCVWKVQVLFPDSKHFLSIFGRKNSNLPAKSVWVATTKTDTGSEKESGLSLSDKSIAFG